MLFLLTVKYTVKVYTPDAYVNREFSLTVRVKGQGEQKTSDQLLINPTEETEGYDIMYLLTKWESRPNLVNKYFII